MSVISKYRPSRKSKRSKAANSLLLRKEEQEEEANNIIKNKIKEDLAHYTEKNKAIRKECAEILEELKGTMKFVKEKGSKKIKKKSVTGSSRSSKKNKMSGTTDEKPIYVELDNGTRIYNMQVAWKRAVATPGTPIAVTPIFHGEETGRICEPCGSKILKYPITCRLPIPGQFLPIKYGTWCSNQLCSVPVTFDDVTEENVYINPSLYASPTMEGPNEGRSEADKAAADKALLEKALNTDWSAKLAERIADYMVTMLELRVYNDCVEILDKIQNVMEGPKAAEDDTETEDEQIEESSNGSASTVELD